MNIMTNAMNRLTRTVIQTDAKFKEYGKEPYGTRKATPEEERERFENMTPEGLMAMVEVQGTDAVNSWLQKVWKEDNNG